MEFGIKELQKILDEDDWKYEVLGETCIKTGIRGDNTVSTIFIVFSENNYICIDTTLDVKLSNISISKKGKLLEYLNEVNSNKLFGLFYIDEEDHTLIYRITLPTEDTLYGQKSILRCLYSVAGTVDSAYPDMMKLIWA